MSGYFTFFVLLLCISKASLSNDVSNSYFTSFSDAIFDSQYPTANALSAFLRAGELSLADSLYASAHNATLSTFYWAFPSQMVIPSLFISAMVIKHWVSFHAEQKENAFLRAVRSIPTGKNFSKRWKDMLEKLGLIPVKDPKPAGLILPAIVLLSCVLLNHVIIQGTLFYQRLGMNDLTHFKKMYGYSACIETFLSALMGNTIATPIYDMRIKESTYSSLFHLLLFCAVRRFFRDWYPHIVGSTVFFITFALMCVVVVHTPSHLADLVEKKKHQNILFVLLSGLGFGIACYLGNVNHKNLTGATEHMDAHWALSVKHLGLKAVRSVWMFFLEDVHFFAGFSVATWNSAFEKFQKQYLAIPAIMTSADTTFVLFINGTERMKYFYQNQERFDVPKAGAVICSDNVTMGVPRQCMNADFYEQSYHGFPDPSTVPRDLFSKALGLKPENLTWDSSVDAWVADYCYHYIRVHPRLHALFSSRLIVPSVTLVFAAIVYIRKLQAARHPAPTMVSLASLPLTEVNIIKADISSYLQSKKVMLQALLDDDSSISTRGADAHKIENKKSSDSQTTTLEEVPFEPWSALQRFMLPFLIMILYFLFQQVLMQAHMYYQYDKTPEAAAKFIISTIYSVEYILTYTIATPIADSLWYYHPKPNSVLSFPASLAYSTVYYFVRRYCRFLRNRDYLTHFFGGYASAISETRLFSTNIRSSMTLAVATAAVYAVGGPLRLISFFLPSLSKWIHETLVSWYGKATVLILFALLTIVKSDVSYSDFADATRSWAALKRCAITIWNALRIDFQYIVTYSTASWPSFLPFLDAHSALKTASTAAEAMKLLVIYAGETASAVPLQVAPFSSS